MTVVRTCAASGCRNKVASTLMHRRTICGACRRRRAKASTAESNRRRREFHVRRGWCRNHKKPAVPGRRYCEACMEANRIDARRRRAAKTVQHCRGCGAPGHNVRSCRDPFVVAKRSAP